MMKNFFSRIYHFSGTWTGTIVIVLFIIFFVAQAFVIPSGSMKNTLLIGDHLFVKKYSYGIPTPHLPWLEIKVFPDFRGDGHLIRGKMPQRGEIVVFRNPKAPKIHFVKRNFAVGGDEVIFMQNSMFLRPHEGDKFITQNYPKEKLVTIDGKLFVKEPYEFKGIRYIATKDAFEQAALATLNREIFIRKNGYEMAMKPILLKEFPTYKELEFNAFYTKVPEGGFFMVGDNRNNSNDSRFWGSVEYKFIVGKPWFVYFSWNSNKEIRWERVGRFVETLQNDERFIYDQP